MSLKTTFILQVIDWYLNLNHVINYYLHLRLITIHTCCLFAIFSWLNTSFILHVIDCYLHFTCNDNELIQLKSYEFIYKLKNKIYLHFHSHTRPYDIVEQARFCLLESFVDRCHRYYKIFEYPLELSAIMKLL